MTGTQFLSMLIVAPLLGIVVTALIGRFQASTVLVAAVLAQMVLLLGLQVWSRVVMARVLSGQQPGLVGVGDAGLTSGRVVAWLLCFGVAIAVAAGSLLLHRRGTRMPDVVPE